jgi:hypothetical protein
MQRKRVFADRGSSDRIDRELTFPRKVLAIAAPTRVR